MVVASETTAPTKTANQQVFEMFRENISSEMKNIFGTSNYVPGHCVMSLEYQDIDSSSLEHVTFAIYNIYEIIHNVTDTSTLKSTIFIYNIFNFIISPNISNICEL